MMQRKFHLPFQNLTPTAWQNLALAAMALFYFLKIVFYLHNNNICGDFAVDFCGYWSAGRIINDRGYGDVYNLDRLIEYQSLLFPLSVTSSPVFETVVIPYLSFFITPFRFLSLIEIKFSFLIWTLINLFGFIFYLRFFTKQLSNFYLSNRIILMILLSLPSFLNLFVGQTNIWLSICGGEILRAIVQKKPLRGGLWLGGWLLKPQLLVLIIPYLLLRRHYKVLVGFLISTTLILIISFLQVGYDGMIQLFDMLIKSSQGGSNSFAEIMMNWRMLGFHIANLTSESVGWLVIILGTIITVTGSLIFLTGKNSQNPTSTALALLGIFAATAAVTWHAHLATAIILVPPMIFLLQKNEFNTKLFFLWVFLPTTLELFTYLVAGLIQKPFFPGIGYVILFLLVASRGLVLNLSILGWTITEYIRRMKMG